MNSYLQGFKGSGMLAVFTVDGDPFLIESCFLNNRIEKTKENIKKLFPIKRVDITYIDPYFLDKLSNWKKEDNVSAYTMLQDLNK